MAHSNPGLSLLSSAAIASAKLPDKPQTPQTNKALKKELPCPSSGNSSTFATPAKQTFLPLPGLSRRINSPFLVDCPFCKRPFSSTASKPYSLPCGHSICQKCLGHQRSTTFRCMCSRQFALETIPPNYSLLELLSRLESQSLVTPVKSNPSPRNPPESQTSANSMSPAVTLVAPRPLSRSADSLKFTASAPQGPSSLSPVSADFSAARGAFSTPGPQHLKRSFEEYSPVSMSPGLNGKSNATGTRKPRKWSRVQRACSNCKRSKTRCDKNRPCSRCVRLNKSSSCMDADLAQYDMMLTFSSTAALECASWAKDIAPSQSIGKVTVTFDPDTGTIHHHQTKKSGRSSSGHKSKRSPSRKSSSSEDKGTSKTSKSRKKAKK